MGQIVGEFSVSYLQVLDEKGKVDSKLMPRISDSVSKKMYEMMVLSRVFDTRCVSLQRQGRSGTYASILGQEAIQIGSVFAVKKQDLIFPSFREQGVYITRGMPLDLLLAFWIGDERGMKIPKDVNVFPVSIPVGSHLPHAVGAGMAFQYQKKKAVSLAYFGDGATSTGDFHEAMNFAGVFKAPVVFICQNNQYAISVPVKEQTAAETLAQKAIAYGFSGIKVDGNDVFAVYKATSEALKKARAGGGPTFIECFTYRRGDHTTADDASRYRPKKEVKSWEAKDPIERLKNYMKKKKLFSAAYEKKVLKWAEKAVDDAVKKAEAMPDQPKTEIFDYMFESLTPDLEEQRKEVQ